jgi:hypothetical protein
VASGSFNGASASYTMDTNVHAYEIIYFVMGAWFYIDDVLVHHFTPTTANMSAVYSLPITAASVNAATGVTSGTLELWAAVISRLGRDVTGPISKQQVGTQAGLVLKRGAGTLHTIAVSAVSNNAVVTLYDSLTATGTVVWSSGSMGALTTPFSVDLHEVPFFTGLTLEIASANATAVVIYE